MNELRAVANDLGNAARKAPGAAEDVVHQEVSRIESQMLLTHGQAVASYSGEGIAHIGGVDATGTNPESLGSPALADVDAGEIADRMSSTLLSDGVSLVVRGGR